MNKSCRALSCTCFALLLLAGTTFCGAKTPDYNRVIRDTAAMVGNGQAQQLARKYGLQIMNVTWEDTGRYKNSSVGPNISDMTIQVQNKVNDKYQLTCMPVIRYPNFSDKTADIPIDKFYVLVGNQKGNDLYYVTLRELLGNLRSYLTKPDSWKGKKTSLLADRDAHVLASAQACFLPVPKGDKATFNPVLFNYQSQKKDPAVLTILATREGTSITVIDNTRDGFSAGRTWGQRLFYNKSGQRASLTGQRLSDFVADAADREENSGATGPEVGGKAGLNMVLMIQVPLKQKNPRRFKGFGLPMTCTKMCRRSGSSVSNVEAAVIGHGKVEGPYTEIDDLEIERDTRFPIRVTVQFYKATSNGVVSPADMASISKEIKQVYDDGDYVGSLVVSGETQRPTEYNGRKDQPADWWQQFWKRHEANTGQTRIETIAMLHQLLGPSWHRLPEAALRKTIAHGVCR